MSLRAQTFSSVRWTAIAAIARGLLQAVQIIVLTRLLQPAEYGLMALVGVVMSFAVLLADLGLSSAYVQRRDVTPAQRSSLFWMNVGASGLLTLFVAVASPLLAWLLGDARLRPLLALGSLAFLLNAIGQQVRMTAEKAMDFRPVVRVEVVSLLLGFAVAVGGALAGLGAYALVLGNLASAAAGALGAWIFLSRGWRPLMHFSRDDVAPYLRFGGAAVVANVLNQVSMSIDLLLGGRLLGAYQLGLFSVPRSLILQIQFVINPIITRVGFPLIAKVQGDRDRIGSIFLQTQNVTASTNAPVYLFIAFFAPEAGAALLGSHWQGSADFLRVLAAWGFVRSTANPVGSLLLGTGRADLAMKWNMGMLLATLPFLMVGARFGAIGLAWALLGLIVVAYGPSWAVLVRPLCNVRFGEYVAAAVRPLLIAVASAALARAAASLFDALAVRLGVGAATLAALYWLLSSLFNVGWTQAMRTLLGLGSRSVEPTA